jgi:hypothetical protein
VDELGKLENDLVQLARLALTADSEDVRLYVARLVRKYRSEDPELSARLDGHLKSQPARSLGSLLRRERPESHEAAAPLAEDSRLLLLREVGRESAVPAPILPTPIQEMISQLIGERRQAEQLLGMGLSPTRSAIFVGPPGIGKTLTAKWIARQLGLPLYILDLTAVMSSFLGRSGTNVRAALDFAKSVPCVLLLDEIDAIAKRRSDDADVGELKRLVTVIMQEVDEWPPSGLLLAATNHPELIDRALWRRFDMILNFPRPDAGSIRAAIQRFLGADRPVFDPWLDVLAILFAGQSLSDTERDVMRLRRSLALNPGSADRLVGELARGHSAGLPLSKRRDLAISLSKNSDQSQHAISDITGVSRDTIRKYAPRNSRQSKRTAVKAP